MEIGYARVLTQDQHLDLQKEVLEKVWGHYQRSSPSLVMGQFASNQE